jgi:hypothetical protein
MQREMYGSAESETRFHSLRHPHVLLIIFYAAALGVRWVVTKWLDRSGAFQRAGPGFLTYVAQKPFAVVLLAAPSAALLWSTSWWVPWLGAWLNGRRKVRSPATAVPVNQSS